MPGTTPARIGAHPWFHISTHKCAYNVCTLPSSLSATSASSGPARENNNKCSYNKEEKETGQGRAEQEEELGTSRSICDAIHVQVFLYVCCFYTGFTSVGFVLWGGGGDWGRHELNATGKLCPHIKLTLVLLCAT